MTQPGFATRLRWRGGQMLMNAMFQSASFLGKLHPRARPSKHGVEVLKDIPYKDTGLAQHTLDVYRPVEGRGLRPVVIYIHGGAFQILSKDTHWVFGLAFARQEYVVFNVNYRLAPQHRYPAGLQDVMEACLWVAEHAEEYGGDPQQLILAGESAGANLSTSVALAAHYEDTEPWARPLWEAELPLRAMLPMCGIMQVSDAERFRRRKKSLPTFIADRIVNIPVAYLPRTGSHLLADPLLFLERGQAPDRPLPPFFTGVGTKDPILDDTRRLKAALDALDVHCDVEYYPGGVHAFHALAWEASARKCWRDQFEFLRRTLETQG